MPKLKPAGIPSYRLHKQSGQAIVTLSGQDILLGKFNSRGSRDEYDRRTAEWLAAGRRVPIDPKAITIAEMVVAFRKHAQRYYGPSSRAAINIDQSLKPLLKLYARTPAVDFGSMRFQAVRDAMIDAGFVRANINRHMIRIRSVFKWAAESEVVDASVYVGLLSVKGITKGRYGAVEGKPVKPVPVEYVDAVLPYVSPQVAAMMQLQLFTGMRPGEACAIRGKDIDTTGNLWLYKPEHHKTAFKDHTREIYLGPRAQDVLRPFLKTDLAANLFSPIDAEAWRRGRLHAARKTPMSCGNKPGSNKRRKPKRSPGTAYTTMTYYRAVIRGCDVADARAKGGMVVGNDERVIPRWHVHQLRHTAGTELRKTHGLEAAQVILGHKAISTTEIYAEKNSEAARRIMAAVG